MTLLNSQSQAFEWPHLESDLEPDPEIRFGSLANGMGFALRPSSEPPERVSVRLVVQAGSLMETESQRGLAHFLEHMAFNGTQHFPPGEMVEYFQRLGMAFGADTNASTGFDRTVYKLELPSGDEGLREESLLLLRDYADGILFAPEEIEKERGIILAEKASRDTVGFRTFQEEIRFLLPDSLFPNRMPIGIESVIREAPKEEFLRFYNEWYHPERTFLVVTGNIDMDAWETAIKEAFASFGKDQGPAPENPNLGAIAPSELRAEIYFESDASAARFELSSVHPLDHPTDSYALRKRQLQLQILHNMLTRRLERMAQEEGSPILSSYSYTEPFFNFAEISGIAAIVEPENWSQAVAIIEQKLRNALEFGFSESEWQEASRNLLQSLQQKVATESTRISREWADDLSAQLNSGQVPISPQQELNVLLEVIKKGGPQSQLELFREIWADSGRGLFLTGPFEDLVTKEELLSQYQLSAEQPVTMAGLMEEIEFPYHYDASVPPSDILEIEDLNITQLRYPNGARVNLKPTMFERDTVYIHFRFGNGALSLPEDQPGLGHLAEGSFVQGGLGRISMDELRSVTAGHSIETRLVVADAAFELQGRTRNEDLPLQMSILRAYLEDPGYRPEGYHLYERSISSMYRELNSQWQGVLHSKVWPYLYGNIHTHAFPTEEEIRARTYEEVQEWLAQPLVKGYLEVTVVGDFDRSSLLPLLDQIVGSLPGERMKQPEEVVLGHPKFPRGETKYFEVQSNIPQGLAMVAWPVQGILPVQESRVLSLLASVYNDRLRLLIREDSGQAYSYQASNNPSWVYDYGIWFGLAVLRPDLVESVSESLRNIALTLKEEPITEDEKIRALAPTVKGLRDMMRTNPYWLRSLGGSQARPEQLDWARSIIPGYESISLEDLQNAAEERLDAQNAAILQIHTPISSEE